MKLTQNFLKKLIETKVKKILKEEEIGDDLVEVPEAEAKGLNTPTDAELDAPLTKFASQGGIIPDPEPETMVSMTPEEKQYIDSFIEKNAGKTFQEISDLLTKERDSGKSEIKNYPTTIAYFKSKKDEINKLAGMSIAGQRAKELANAAKSALDKKPSQAMAKTTPEDMNNMKIIEVTLEQWGYLDPKRQKRTLYTKEFHEGVKKFKQDIKGIRNTPQYAEQFKKIANFLPITKTTDFHKYLSNLADVAQDFEYQFTSKEAPKEVPSRFPRPANWGSQLQEPMAGAQTELPENKKFKMSYVEKIIKEEYRKLVEEMSLDSSVQELSKYADSDPGTINKAIARSGLTGMVRISELDPLKAKRVLAIYKKIKGIA